MLSQRDPAINVTTLSGDLTGDDVPDACTQDSPDCDSLGGLCLDGFCIIKQNNSENSYHIVTGSGTDATAVIDGFTITGGNADGTTPDNRGAGLHNDSGSPTVTNCTFSGNSATSGSDNAYGGGMSNWSLSNPTVTNCTFSGNSASGSFDTFGGGMVNWTGSSPTVTNCTFSGNSVSGSSIHHGGGMHNSTGDSPTVTNCAFSGNKASRGGGMENGPGSSPTVTNCTFSGNSATTFGGGMNNFVVNSNTTVTNCVFSGNQASGGGGVHNDTSSPTVANCVFSENEANTGGGVMNFSNSSPTVTNCTFSGNSGTIFGGGMYNVGSSPTVTNCIFWGNSDSGGMDESAQIHIDSGTPVVDYSIVQGGWGGAGGAGIVNSDPLFVDADGPDDIPGTADDDLRLLFGSPAIDAGDNDAVPADTADLDNDMDTAEPIPFDLDGNQRFLDDPFTDDTGNPGLGVAIVDMGAYEFASDCNENGIPDDKDVAGETSSDCNENGVPDECEIDKNSQAPGGPFFCNNKCDPDCDGNGIPDECDIANCPLDTPACEDCNLNGVPDGCDIDAGTSQDVEAPFGVPDECSDWTGVQNANWSNNLNWDPPGVPDNVPKGQTFSVNIEREVNPLVNVVLDINATIDSLQLIGGPSLNVTGGDLTIATEKGMVNEGRVQIDNAQTLRVPLGSIRVSDFCLSNPLAGCFPPPSITPGITMSSSGSLMALSVLIQDGTSVDLADQAGIDVTESLNLVNGMYQADPDAITLTSASLSAGSVLITNEPFGRGHMILQDTMSASTIGSFALDISSECESLGTCQPPRLEILDAATLNVGGTFIVEDGAEVVVGGASAAAARFVLAAPVGSAAMVTLSGDFDNRSRNPDDFNWTGGTLVLDGVNQTFELASQDFGSFEGGLFSNFAIPKIEVAEGTAVTFVDSRVNNPDVTPPAPDALYVGTLVLGNNATVTIEGGPVYYQTLINNGATINGELIEIDIGIPAVSEWGLVIMVLLFVTVGTVVFRRHQPGRV
ncbi:MAG: right-handed parallel beta-helix repeat-containing protein [Phycisphaerae bacterium]